MLNVILKTDVHGSLEAIQDSLLKLSTEKVKINLIHTGVGGITESDVLLASASGAIVMGFNVRPETKAIGVAQGEGVDIKLYKIIYEMMEDVKLAMKGMLAPKKIEKYLGRAEVRQTFTVSKVGNVAGCHVVDGKLTRSANLRLLRDNVVVFEGKVSTLKRFKDDAREVTQGLECGVGIEGYNDIKPGDLIEAFDVTLVQPDLFVLRVQPGKAFRSWKEVGTPLLVIEALSPSTAPRDRGKKRRIYQRAGVAEYWIVDLDARLIERWRPGDERPEIVDERMQWELPGGAKGGFEVGEIFAALT